MHLKPAASMLIPVQAAIFYRLAAASFTLLPLFPQRTMIGQCTGALGEGSARLHTLNQADIASRQG